MVLAADVVGDAALALAFKLGLGLGLGAEASGADVAWTAIRPVTFAPVGLSTARVDLDVCAVAAVDGRGVEGAAWLCGDCAARDWARDGGDSDG